MSVLTRITITNFRCLREVSVPLKPLTVLIGPNDSGKSTFLSAFRHLAATVGPDRADFWLHDTQAKIRLVTEFGDGRTFEKCSNHPFSSPYAILGTKPGDLGECVPFVLPSTGAVMETQGYSEASQNRTLSSDGSDVPSLLDTFLRKDRVRFFDLVKKLRELIPGLTDINIATPNASTRRLDLLFDNGLDIPASQASVGVRFLLLFVALCHHPDPPGLILIEEPENGVHPRRIGEIVDLLRAITEGQFGGRPAQVILTTHSPYLLDSIDPSKDQVLVFQRNPNGSRSAEPVDTERLSVCLDDFMLGEVWYNQGEKGLVSAGS